jgi:hypothetical protein
MAPAQSAGDSGAGLDEEGPTCSGSAMRIGGFAKSDKLALPECHGMGDTEGVICWPRSDLETAHPQILTRLSRGRADRIQESQVA